MSSESVNNHSKWRGKIARVAGLGALVLFLPGLAIRLTIRDRYLVANTIYYATPWSVLCLLGIASAWWMRRHSEKRFVAASILSAAFACAAMWTFSSWSFGNVRRDGDGVRVVTWNVAHGRWGLSGLAAAAADLKPDIAVFVEADPSQVDVRQTFKTAFPEHQVFLLGGGIVLVSRWPGGEARASQFGDEKVETRIREIDLSTPWGTWTVIGCDFASNVLYQRESHVRELARRVAACLNPVIVAGDFNTPLDSVHLELLREAGLREAFEASGSGYLPTWPAPVPVLSLDQMWIGRPLQPISCVRRWHWRSDHAAVLATIDPGAD